jgi:hypothetical protein
MFPLILLVGSFTGPISRFSPLHVPIAMKLKTQGKTSEDLWSTLCVQLSLLCHPSLRTPDDLAFSGALLHLLTQREQGAHLGSNLLCHCVDISPGSECGNHRTHSLSLLMSVALVVSHILSSCFFQVERQILFLLLHPWPEQKSTIYSLAFIPKSRIIERDSLGQSDLIKFLYSQQFSLS